MQRHQIHDPFTVNPIRRSFVAVIGSVAVIYLPFRFSEAAGETVMLSIGWLAMAVLIFSAPIMVWCIGEELVHAIYRRLHPPVTDLDLPDRVIHILHRHGVRTIRAARQLDPAAFHLMANMAPRDAEAVVRALNLWYYRRWQEAGFPANGGD